MPNEYCLLKKHKCTIIFFFLCCLISFIETESAIAQGKNQQLNSYLRQGIEKTLNLEAQSAMGFFNKAVELDREEPTGYAFLALAHLFFHEISYQPAERVKNKDSMLRYADEALAKGQKRIENDEKDGQAYFAMAMATIVKVRWALRQKSYFAMAHDTSTAWDYMQKAQKINPQFTDIYFPIGLLHYHIDHLPGLARFFSSLLITAGNQRQGLQELSLVAQKGDLLKELAQAELVSTYLYFEKQPIKALAMAMDLKEKFPQNYNFAFALANTYAELYRFPEALAIAQDLHKNIQAGKPPFIPQLQSRYDILMGRIFFNQGEYAESAEYLQRVLKDTTLYNARNRAAALLRLGMIHDIRQERKEAEDCYSKVLEIEGGEGSAQVEAKKYLHDPYLK
jgi:tetratricopeptide (TPR) repeat protein